MQQAPYTGWAGQTVCQFCCCWVRDARLKGKWHCICLTPRNPLAVPSPRLRPGTFSEPALIKVSEWWRRVPSISVKDHRSRRRGVIVEPLKRENGTSPYESQGGGSGGGGAKSESGNGGSVMWSVHEDGEVQTYCKEQGRDCSVFTSEIKCAARYDRFQADAEHKHLLFGDAVLFLKEKTLYFSCCFYSTDTVRKTKTLRHNGSASDSTSEGCMFKSCQGQENSTRITHHFKSSN